MLPVVARFPAPVVSVVLCTYNRAPLLAGALEALLAQREGTPFYEVIVVDNNSDDRTRDVVEGYLATGVVRYGFESRQGLSTARNRGVSLARADLIAFTDDDVRVSNDWIRSVARAFTENTDVGIVGGKVEPVWEEVPPSWLREAGDAPLAIADFGQDAFRLTRDRSMCLLGANVAVRREVFDRVGGFSTSVQRVGDGIGSTEDHDFQMRVQSLGVPALYEPRIKVRAPIPRERLRKRYHRAWHRGHGRFYALMRDPAFERSKRGSFLGVPVHVYRTAFREAAGWGASLLSGRGAAAFAHELRLRFLLGFTVQRISRP